MERLTKIDGIGQNEAIKCFGCGIETAGADLEHCGYCEHWRAILDRLAEYEDTGLTPDEVRAYKDVEEQGLLVRLTERLALAMRAGARAIENNRRYESATYVYDVFQVGKELFYREAARLLREEAEKALKGANR